MARARLASPSRRGQPHSGDAGSPGTAGAFPATSPRWVRGTASGERTGKRSHGKEVTEPQRHLVAEPGWGLGPRGPGRPPPPSRGRLVAWCLAPTGARRVFTHFGSARRTSSPSYSLHRLL